MLLDDFTWLGLPQWPYVGDSLAAWQGSFQGVPQRPVAATWVVASILEGSELCFHSKSLAILP